MRSIDYRGYLGHATTLAALVVEDVEHEEVLAQYNKCGYAHLVTSSMMNVWTTTIHRGLDSGQRRVYGLGDEH